MRVTGLLISCVLGLWASNVGASTNVVASGFVAVTTGSGSMQISAFKLDGTTERRLTKGPANHHYPSLSRDGTQLLYTGDEGGRDEIYRINLAESAVPIQITRPPLIANSASWSPDGRSIVYSGLVPGAPAYQIFVADPNGSKPVQLTHTADSGNAQPVFSPDGARIAYINGREATRLGTNGSTVTGIENRIWVMAADGSAAAPLTPGPLDAYPSWLDANTVLFARSDFLSDSSRIVSVRLDGGERVQSPPNQYFVEPKPLPDGRSYGATMEFGSELHLVKVFRMDGARLTEPRTSEFVIERFAIPEADGSSFTIAWILAVSRTDQPARTPPYAVLGLGIAGLMILVLFAGASYRRRVEKN